MLVLRLVVAAAGVVLAASVVLTAVRIFVVPRGVRAPLVRLLFSSVARALGWFARVRGAREHHERDRFLVLWAPIAVLLLPVVWLMGALVAYAAIFWAIDPDAGIGEAFVVSGSSLFTLGFARPPGVGPALVACTEAAVGIGLLAIVISYLPTLNSALARREQVVAMLDSRAGTPADPLVLYQRQLRYAGLEHLDASWEEWERWIVDLGESHYTHGMLAFFRSSNPAHSWIGAVSTLLDTANLRLAALDAPGSGNASAYAFMQAGLVAMTRMANHFDLVPAEGYFVVDRERFERTLDELASFGAPLYADRDRAWRWFDERRRQYMPILAALCRLVDAPPTRAWGDAVAAPTVPVVSA
jgi:hypothetical protein